MLEPADAEALLEKHRATLPIPAQATLAYVERRCIELASYGELETLAPVAGASSSTDPAPSSDEAMEIVPETAAGEDADAGVDATGRPTYTEATAWVGRFAYQIFSWELAIDDSGKLIRIRKSR